MSAESKPHSDLLWNCLSILVLAGILVAAAVVLVIFVNPYSALNPLQPPTPHAIISLPIVISESTPAPANTIAATLPVITIATSTASGVPPTAEVPTPGFPTPNPETSKIYEFVVFEGTLALPASEYDPARGCEWMGVAGQVFDIQGTPVRGLRISLRAVLDGNLIEMIGMSGTALLYGESGYEIKLADKPIASSGQAAVQLIDQGGLPLSDLYIFDTSDSCDENLILIDFQEIR